MASAHDHRSDEGESFLEGKLLIALPGMGDERFAQTVIYMCAHSSKGAMGIVINKPIPGLSFAEVMKQLKIETKPSAAELPILYGGPVETGRGFVLHSGDYESSDSTMPVSQDISLTATLDILRAIAEGRGPKHVLFALGYAGWAPGQIESEFQTNGWLHCESDPSLVFGVAADAKWRTALQRLGVGPSGLVSDTGRA
ncbi:MAG TPA: YqgE/AlgH family protein [Micropepsaceae bacterium]|jgi:putative transcriptional regulator|nr:YqgE/AlgH family protein [Micropepsaceae bacterium]